MGKYLLMDSQILVDKHFTWMLMKPTHKEVAYLLICQLILELFRFSFQNYILHVSSYKIRVLCTSISLEQNS